jgi:hypothetical protein
MTDVVLGDGRVRRTPEVVAALRLLAGDEPSLVDLVDVAPESLPWGATGLFFAGRWHGSDALLKVGVSASQRWWSTAIADRDPGLAPRVLASGSRLADAEVGWMLMERLPGGLHPGWGGREFGLLMDAGARFQRIARTMDPAPASALTVDDVRSWITAAASLGAPGPVDALLARVADDWACVTAACGTEICHGDLHMANALMRRPAPDPGPALLIDFEPCRMPWVFDAAYPQILNSDPARAGWHDLAGQLADRRRAHGLPVCTDAELRRASAIALGWYAARMWGMLGATPDPGWRPADVWRRENRRYIEAGAAARG